jgi:Tol biopolymer transport system component
MGIAWSRDGSLVYGASSFADYLFHLWRVDGSGKLEPKRYDLAGFGAARPSIASVGDRLAFDRYVNDAHIRRYHVGEDPKPFLASKAIDTDAEFSPDGSRVVFGSGRSDERIEIWTAYADGTRPIQLTSGPGHGQGSPRWSPDGRLIAFDSQDENGQWGIYVIDADGGRPRPVNSGGDAIMPTWSRDGGWIYFSSNRTGRNEVWRIPFGGGEAQQVTRNGGYLALESTDGKTLFYSFGGKVFAKNLADGSEAQVLDSVNLKRFRPVEDGIYYIGYSGPDGRFPLEFYDFTTRKSRLLTYMEGQTGAGGLSVSQDRKTILYTDSVHPVSDLMMIENFR